MPNKTYSVTAEPDGFAKCNVQLLNNENEVVHEYALQASAELLKCPMPGKYHDRYGVSPDPGCYQLANDILIDAMDGSFTFGAGVLAEFIRDFLTSRENLSFDIRFGDIEQWLVARGLLAPEPAKTDLEKSGLTGDAPNPNPAPEV